MFFFIFFICGCSSIPDFMIETDDSTDSELEDSTDNEPEDSTDSELEDSTDNEPEDSTDSELKDSTDNEPEDSTDSELEDSTDNEPEDSTDSELEDSTDNEPEDGTCPGNCQYTSIDYDLALSFPFLSGFSIPSSQYVLFCDDGTPDMGFNYPYYSGYIRDDSYSCSDGLYCCRPQTDLDHHCNDCRNIVNSSDVITNNGFCIFASNMCFDSI